MRAHPWFVSGTGRLEVELAATVPGAIGKVGAEGVFAAALPDGRALVVKVLDGALRPLPVVVAAALRALGVSDLGSFGSVPVLGHGEPVGQIEPTDLLTGKRSLSKIDWRHFALDRRQPLATAFAPVGVMADQPSWPLWPASVSPGSSVAL